MKLKVKLLITILNSHYQKDKSLKNFRGFTAMLSLQLIPLQLVIMFLSINNNWLIDFKTMNHMVWVGNSMYFFFKIRDAMVGMKFVRLIQSHFFLLAYFWIRIGNLWLTNSYEQGIIIITTTQTLKIVHWCEYCRIAQTDAPFTYTTLKHSELLRKLGSLIVRFV